VRDYLCCQHRLTDVFYELFGALKRELATTIWDSRPSPASPALIALVPVLVSPRTPPSSPRLPQILVTSPVLPGSHHYRSCQVVNSVSRTSCSTPRLSALARDHMRRWTYSYIKTYSLLFHMFCFIFLYPRLVALFSSLPLVSFAIGLQLSLFLAPAVTP
jgi:hypothetical protein